MTILLACIIAGMALEAVVLTAYHHRTGQGVSPGALLPNLSAGAFLLIAMILSLGGAPWPFISLSLFAALIGHATDLRLRWANPSPSRPGSSRPPAPVGTIAKDA